MHIFVMSCGSKEKMDKCDSNNLSKSQNETSNLCKSHTTVKLDREMYRICPSKLSKRELEDLYFTLLESNVDLKKTINGQHDKIRVLSTQVHRMSNVQEKMMSKESKECCLGTKAIVNEQKDFISDLKEKNQHMAERIEQLNMRLCSAKQFLKSNPPQTSGKAMRHPAKHDCLKLPIAKTTSSSQWEDSTPKKNAQTQVDVLLEEQRMTESDRPCNENRCRTLMEDLKIKIVTLQEELSSVHSEYSNRISRLESEVAKVRKENIRVSSEFTASEHELHNHSKRTTDAMTNYRNAEAKCAHLAAELSIEKRKVAELEAQVKASIASFKVHKAIEDHLSTIRESNGPSEVGISKSSCSCCHPDENEKVPPKILPPLHYSKQRDSEDPSSKNIAMKYSPSRSSSSVFYPQKKVSKTSSTSGFNGECACLSSKVTSTPNKDATGEECICLSSKVTCTLIKDPKSEMCDCPSKVVFMPIEECNMSNCKCQLTSGPGYSPTTGQGCINDDCVCDCSLTQTKEANSKCLKCCFMDEYAATESPPQKNANSRSPRRASEKNGSKPFNTYDDSEYLDDNKLAERQEEQIKNKKSMKDAHDETNKPALLTTQAPVQPDYAERRVEQTENQKSAVDAHDEANKPALLTTQAHEKPDYNPNSQQQDGSKSCSNTGDVSGYVDDNELSVLKQTKELLEKILELQRQIHSTKAEAVRPVKQNENQMWMKDAHDKANKPALMPTQAPEQPEYVERREEQIENRKLMKRASDEANEPALLTNQAHEMPDYVERRVEQIENQKSMKDANDEANKLALLTTQAHEMPDYVERRVEQIENQKSMKDASDEANKPALLTNQAHEMPDYNANSRLPRRATEQDDSRSLNTYNDSGYMDINELDVLKQKKELLEKILELQRQIHSTKAENNNNLISHIERPVQQIENQMSMTDTHDESNEPSLLKTQAPENPDYTQRRIQEIENLMSMTYKDGDADKSPSLATQEHEDTKYNANKEPRRDSSSRYTGVSDGSKYLNNSDLSVLKQKKELLENILELQRQIHSTKAEAEIPVRQIENQMPMKDARDDANKPALLTTQAFENPDYAERPVQQIENQIPIKCENCATNEPAQLTSQAPEDTRYAQRPVQQIENRKLMKNAHDEFNKPALLTTQAPGNTDYAERRIEEIENQKLINAHDQANKPALLTTQAPGNADYAERRIEDIENQKLNKYVHDEAKKPAPLTTQSPEKPDYNANTHTPRKAGEKTCSKSCCPCDDPKNQDVNKLAERPVQEIENEKSMKDTLETNKPALFATQAFERPNYVERRVEHNENQKLMKDPNETKKPARLTPQAFEKPDYTERRIQEIENLMSMKYKDGNADKSPSLATQEHEDTNYNANSHLPMKASEQDGSKPFRSSDDSRYMDNNELSVLKQKKELLEKILELQRQIHSTKIGAEPRDAYGEANKPALSSTQALEKPDYTQRRIQEIENLMSMTYKNGDANKSAKLNTQAYEDTNYNANREPRRDSSSRDVVCACDDSGYQDDSQLSVLNQKKDLLAKILELQRQVHITKIGAGRSPQQIGNQRLKGYENYDPYKPATHMTCCDKQMSETQPLMPREMVNTQILGNHQEARTSMVAAWPTTDDTRAKTITLADGTQQIIDQRTPNEANDNHFRNLIESARDHKLKITEKHKPNFEKNLNNEHLKMAMTDKLTPGFNPEKLKYLEAEGIIPGSGQDLPQINEKFESITRNVLRNPENLAGKLPATEALAASNPTAANQTPNTKKGKGVCEGCAGCTECEIKNEHTMNRYANNELPIGIQKEQAKKHDQHNSLQIPGPIPSLDCNKHNTHRNKSGKPRKDNANKEAGTPRVLPRSATDGMINLPDVPQLHNREVSFNNFHIPKDTKVDKKSETQNLSIKDGPSLLDVIIHIDSTQSHPIVPILPAPVNREQTTQVDRAQMSTNVAQNTDQKLPEASSQAPATESAWQSRRDSVRKRDAVVNRRRSITPCARTELPQDDPSACDCDKHQDGCCTNRPSDKGIQAKGCEEFKHPKYIRHAHSAPQRGTYTIDFKLTATSPDNTDLEMSCLSDLPLEKEKKCSFKQRSLSPGEDRTTTYSSSYSVPTTYTLSEGEMPAISKRSAPRLESPPAQQMEEALQAIADELKRCKTLLHSYRPTEHPHRECGLQTSPTDISRRIALRPGLATQGIGDTHAPTSIFTLHIGTVVLSDEGVLNSQDKNLVLKWKFYDQSVAMTRMPACRVILYNFSTEYDIQVTDDFLNYLKHEEMPIFLEVEREEQPYARSTLPLRDVLLYPNTRVDISLALVPPVGGPGAGSLGVLDAWCMLRAGPDVLPRIHLAVSQPASAACPHHFQPAVIPQGLDDYRDLSLMAVKSQPVPTQKTPCSCPKNSVEYSRSDERMFNLPSQPTGQNTRYEVPHAGAAVTGQSYDPSKYPPPRERYAQPHAKPHAHTASPFVPPTRYDTTQDIDQDSEIIISEVNPKVKSPGDIMQALEKNKRLRDSKFTPKPEYEVLSQTRSSFSSARSLLTDSGSKGHRNTEIHGGDRRTFIHRLKKASEIIGSNNAESKKVTISSPIYSNMEEPQRDIVQEPKDEMVENAPKMEITILWLALNEECDAMADPHIQRLYVAYTFLGRSGAELETPVSLPKPRHYVDKCFFNFKKSFELEDTDFLQLSHMAQCRAGSKVVMNENDCIVFTVISEPPEDPLGIESCEDVGYAYLYLGDLLSYSSNGFAYTEVIPVHAVLRPATVCGVLAVRVDGLDIVRRCLLLNPTFNE